MILPWRAERRPRLFNCLESVRTAAGLAVAALYLTGCGYVGDPLPPLLNIPSAVSDLKALQRGDRILIDFTAPALTTEGVGIKDSITLDLRIGPSGQGPFDPSIWSSSATQIPVTAEPGKTVDLTTPSTPWTGREVFIAINIIGENGKPSGWSNIAVLRVVPPLSTPAQLRAASDPQGVKLTWQGSAPNYRVYRQMAGEEAETLRAVANTNTFIDDDATYGKEYSYRVQAIQKAGSAEAESGRSERATITPADEFAPAAPANIRAVAGLNRIELAWDPNAESDFASYKIYRAEGDAEFSFLADANQTPSYGDGQVERGKRYRYAITAVDQAGNESGRSEVAEAVAP